MAEETKIESTEVVMNKLNPIEKTRTYLFPKGEKIEIQNVTEFGYRPSGSHRLKTTDGKLYIVNPGWLAIELICEEFTL